jgi:hypothetical protein
VKQAHKVYQENQEQPVSKACQVNQGPMEQQDRKDHPDHKVR